MFAQKLRYLRKNHPGLTQAKLAELFGVSQQAVGLWERGKNMPTHDIVKQIASYFCVSTDYLLDKTDNPSEPVRTPATPPSTPALTPQEQDLLRKNRQLTPAGRSQLDTYLDFLLSQESASAVKRKTAT
ncbi:helix-turn-helix domain-containing protein [Mitsuokella sp. UBA4253]|uniref:helix-turn-helix domain-containing protein n=1 Tax=Mitsuokella sp. UBA4253 TaxID=1946959 RepID=UPI0025809C38|nr:helix-turn-helix transcriptional regulator [Mitsuokella sp. UBA4253]